MKTRNRPNSADLLGIFGQNGSGKSGVIESLDVLKSLMCREPLKEDVSQKICQGENSAKFTFEFNIQNGQNSGVSSSVFYSFKITQIKEDFFASAGGEDAPLVPNIFDESLKIPRPGKNPLTLTVSRDTNELLSAAPKKCFTALVRKIETEGRTRFIIDREKIYSRSLSFLFSQKFGQFLEMFEKDEEINTLRSSLQVLRKFASEDFFVITTGESGRNAMECLFLPFNLHHNKQQISGTYPFLLDKPNPIPLPSLPSITKLIHQLNLVLTQLIPGMTLKLEEMRSDLNEKGEEIKLVYLSSVREGKVVPLKYESAGVRKIISILQFIILVYNIPGVTVAVDDIDSGIFEYLLGEILFLIQDGGKGQLIFTCHNLRPLEMLSNRSIIFSSTDPEQRFVPFGRVQKTNNLRDLFYREIMLGLQKKPLYEPTNNSDIAAALQEAGSIGNRCPEELKGNINGDC